jgi:hypothetical protein
MWYKSLTKIYSLYKKQLESFSIGSLDYFCLKEKLCIMCNERSHHIDFKNWLGAIQQYILTMETVHLNYLSTMISSSTHDVLPKNKIIFKKKLDLFALFFTAKNFPVC